MREPSFIVCLLLAVAASSLPAQDVPILEARDLPGGSIGKTSYYAGEALFGYIDGGAELYLEYGFKRLGRQEILFLNEKLVVEIYQMAGAYEAYGVFSIQRFKCAPIDSLFPNTCLSKYQLQAVVGDCYLSIINESGSSAAEKANLQVFRTLRSKIKPQQVNFPRLFQMPEFNPYRRNLIVVRGRLGVQNSLSEWDTLLGGVRRFSLTVLPLEEEGKHLTIAHIRFGSEDELGEFVRRTGFSSLSSGIHQSMEQDGNIRLIKRLNSVEVVYAEAARSFPALESFLSVLKGR